MCLMRRIGVITTALILVSTIARADIIQTQTFGPETADFSTVLTFDRYSGNLSDITGILVELSITSIGGLAQIDNDAAQVRDVHVEFGNTSYLNSADVTLPTSLTNPLAPVTTVNSGDFYLESNDGDPKGTVEVGTVDYGELPGGTITNSLSGVVLSTSYSEYVGAGTFSITGLIASYLSVTGDRTRNVYSQLAPPPTLTGYVNITYQTTAGPSGSAPEPSTMVLFATSLIGLVGWRRLRKSKQI